MLLPGHGTLSQRVVNRQKMTVVSSFWNKDINRMEKSKHKAKKITTNESIKLKL